MPIRDYGGDYCPVSQNRIPTARLAVVTGRLRCCVSAALRSLALRQTQLLLAAPVQFQPRSHQHSHSESLARPTQVYPEYRHVATDEPRPFLKRSPDAARWRACYPSTTATSATADSIPTNCAPMKASRPAGANPSVGVAQRSRDRDGWIGQGRGSREPVGRHNVSGRVSPLAAPVARRDSSLARGSRTWKAAGAKSLAP
jgi:hypothetical protein